MGPELAPRVLALVALGGAVGALLRYVVSGYATRGDFPWGTFVVNFTGSLILGYLVFGDALAGWLSPDARAFAALGLLGAYTTMSTFSVETVALLQEGGAVPAAWNVLLNAGLCLAGAYLGRLAAMATVGGL